ncbi:MAG: hypothetical protein WKF31_13080 [Thermoleophilaceae bacterium]
MAASDYTLRDWLREHPPGDAAFSQTVADVARRRIAGEASLPAVRELLEQVLAPRYRRPARSRSRRGAPRHRGRPSRRLPGCARRAPGARRRSSERPAWALEPALARSLLVRERRPGLPGARDRAVPGGLPAAGVFIAAGALERC